MNSKDGVGYKKPPKKSQFKKGKSGNPKGRPKGTKNLKTDFKEEMSENLSFRENGVEKRHSKRRLILKGLIAKALKGDARATAQALNLSMKFLSDDDDNGVVEDVPYTKAEEALLDNLEQRLAERRKAKGEENEE